MFVALAILSYILSVVALPGNMYMDPCLEPAFEDESTLFSTLSGILGHAGITDA